MFTSGATSSMASTMRRCRISLLWVASLPPCNAAMLHRLFTEPSQHANKTYIKAEIASEDKLPQQETRGPNQRDAKTVVMRCSEV